MEKKLNAAESKWLRRILRISYVEHISNEEIRTRTQQQLVSKVIKKRRMKWAGHVLRMDENRTRERSSITNPKEKELREDQKEDGKTASRKT